MAQIFRSRLNKLLPLTAASAIPCLAPVLATSACASFCVADTQPLPAAKLEPPGADRISKGGCRVDVLSVSLDTPDRLTFIAMSSGGKQSASSATAHSRACAT
jgi:hypothetical protein